MIKEVLENKIDKSVDNICEAIIEYMGEEYRDEILRRMRKTAVLLVKENGFVENQNEEVYVGEEPVCIKSDDEACILLPISLFKEKRGNIIFVHNILHALSNENFESDEFNEVVVDYMANEIGKGLESRKVNIVFDDKPKYESKSFYSRLFPLVDSFFKENKEEVIKRVMGKEYYLDKEEIKKISEKIEKCIDEAFEVKKEVKANKKR